MRFRFPRPSELANIADESVAQLRREIVALRGGGDRSWIGAHEDVGYIVRFAAAALRFRDGTIFSDFTIWLSSVLEARQAPSDLIERSYRTIAASLPEHHAAIRNLISSAVV